MCFGCYRFGNTAYLHISVAFIQMLKALMPVATFLVAIICGTDKARCDVFLNMVLFLQTMELMSLIGRTGAVTIRVAGVLKDWILIALSTVIFPESTITGLNIIGYGIALCGVVMYNYIKVKDVRASQSLAESIPDRITKDWKFEKKSSDVYVPDNVSNSSGGNGSASDMNIDEEAPLISSSRLSHIGRTQLTNHAIGK
ncbi:hypothetical protein SESBI_15644 [Sesbania bispinosa]|nr:hypothetical protein SESBI_15644 [Sesbania bispinosa]